MLKIKVSRYNYISGEYEPVGYYKRIDSIEETPVLICGDFEDSRRFRSVSQIRRILTMLDMKFSVYSYEIEDVSEHANN